MIQPTVNPFKSNFIQRFTYRLGLFWTLLVGAALLISTPGCQPHSTPPSQKTQPVVMAAESFLSDLVQVVAGDQLRVSSLIPAGLDPHAFEATPGDIARLAESQVLVINGQGLETWIQPLLENAGGQRLVIEASAGLQPRAIQHYEQEQIEEGHDHEVDPHFWLDPIRVITYIENIVTGLAKFDPQNAGVYQQNGQAYIIQLQELDAWIQTQVAVIPEARRLMITNHESFGYFADRYGFRMVGAIIPSVSTHATASAQQTAKLIEDIRSSGAPAIFLETSANPQMAEQLARETGVKIVANLYTHSLTEPGGEAPTYLTMMRHNVHLIVEALK